MSSDKSPKKILFIGNSHTYFNDMPEMLRSLAASRGYEFFTVQNTCGGRTLQWHYSQPDVRFNVLFGNYDYIVLQHQAHPFPGKEHLTEGVDMILKFTSMSSSKVLGYMGWSEQNNPEGHAAMSSAWHDLSAERDVELVAVGDVWNKIRTEHPELSLYFKDGEHASPLGSYLVACAFFRKLTGESTVGLPDKITFPAPSYDGNHDDNLCAGPTEHTFDKQAAAFIQRAVDEII